MFQLIRPCELPPTTRPRPQPTAPCSPRSTPPTASTPADFNFSDTDSGDTLEKVKIVTLPTAGTLALNDTEVTANQEITKTQLDADQLVFTPATNGIGEPYATFTFKVNDGDAESTATPTP